MQYLDIIEDPVFSHGFKFAFIGGRRGLLFLSVNIIIQRAFAIMFHFVGVACWG